MSNHKMWIHAECWKFMCIPLHEQIVYAWTILDKYGFVCNYFACCNLKHLLQSFFGKLMHYQNKYAPKPLGDEICYCVER